MNASSRSEKFVVYMSILAAILPLALTLVGALAKDHDWLGYLVFGVVLSGIIVSLVLVFASWAMSNRALFPRVVWLALMLVSLAIIQFLFTRVGSQVDVVAIYLLLALTFPLGLIGLLIFLFIDIFSQGSLLVFCLSLLFIGWFQWFLVVPNLIQRGD
jgi:membrane-associated HD superfamily phosphohydrolase